MSGVQISATVQGLDGIRNRFKQAAGRITGRTSQMIDLSLGQAKRTVAAGTPVRTGTARSGWVVDRSGALEGTLWNPVLYVPFLVLGTRYMSASVALNAAIEKATADINLMAAQLGNQLVADLTKDY